MMVMPANHSSPRIHYWAGRYPGKVGWLVGPSARKKTKLRPWMPYALDNDAYSAWANNTPWSEDEWFELLDWAVESNMTPRWILVPDEVTNREATIEKWHHYSPIVRTKYGFTMAFAVQDGMTESDVPADAEVVFVGGSSDWKWENIDRWVGFPRVHVGKVNTVPRLIECHRRGFESADGTGWMRDDSRRDKMSALEDWIVQTAEFAKPNKMLVIEE